MTLENGSICEDFYWKEDEVRGYPDKADSQRYWFTVHHAPSGTKIEGFSSEPDRVKGYPDKDGKYWSYAKYTECGPIKQWMEEKDRNYLARLKQEEAPKQLPFYEGKVGDVSIAKLPFQTTVMASSSSSRPGASCALQKVSQLERELSKMGLTDTDDSAYEMVSAFKSTQWESTASANQEIFGWLSQKYTHNFVISLFQSVVKGSDAPDIHLVAFMMHAANSVVLFKFPFTLTSILWKEAGANRAILKQLIYLGLKRVAEEQIVSDPESKCIAMFKLLLKSALKKGMITEVQFHQLDNMAEKSGIFSDERFLALKRDVESLKQQFTSLESRVNVGERNMQMLADSVNGLKEAFRDQKERRLYFSIATFGLSFFGAQGLVDIVAGVADLTDLAEIGSVVMQVPVEQSQSYLDGGLQALHESRRNIARSGAEIAIKKLGLNPDQFIETWMEADVLLHGSAQEKQALTGQSQSVNTYPAFSSGYAASVSSSSSSSQAMSKLAVSSLASGGYQPSSSSPMRMMSTSPTLPQCPQTNLPTVPQQRTESSATYGAAPSPIRVGDIAGSRPSAVPGGGFFQPASTRPSSSSSAAYDYNAPPPALDDDDDVLEAQVIGNYRARGEQELTVVKGGVVAVLEQKPSGWWLCELNGKQGLVPGNRLQLMSSVSQLSPHY